MTRHEINGLIEKRAKLLEKNKKLCDRAEIEGRDLRPDEIRDFEKTDAEHRKLTDQIARAEAILAANPMVIEPRKTRSEGYTDNRSQPYALLGRESRLADRYGESDGYSEYDGEYSLGRLVRGMVTGHWQGGESEKRALSEATVGAGGNLLPSPISSYVIDRIRNQARVIEAGATTVAMESDTLSLPRLTTGVTAAWRTENTPVAQSDPVFDRVTLQARTLAVLTLLSYELFQDLTPAGSEIIERELIQSLAVELDRAALRGSGTAPEPRGIRNIPGVTTVTNGTNGTAFSWDQPVAVVAAVEANGFDAGAIIASPRALKSAAALKDSTGRYLDPPAYLEPDNQVLVTNQIGTTYTTGTSTDTSEMYCGEWPQLLIGFRPQIGISLQASGGPSGMVGVKASDSAYMSQMSVAILAFLRADVAVTHPEAFAVATGVRP